MRIKKRGEPTADQRNLRGRLVIRHTDAGLVAQKWPRSRGPSTRPGDVWWRGTWGTAAQMSSRPYARDLDFATAWSQGTKWLPRDLLTAAALGLLFRIEFEDGTEWESVLTVAANPQATLDLITNTVGAMLYRTANGWVEVPPGNPATFLQNNHPSPPSWVPLPGYAGAPTMSRARVSLTASKSSQNLSVFGPLNQFDQADVDTAARWNIASPARFTFGAGDAGRMALVTLQLQASTIAAGADTNLQIRHYTSAGALRSNAGNRFQNGGATLLANVSYISLPLLAGDYIRAEVSVVGATNVTVGAPTTHYALTMIS